MSNKKQRYSYIKDLDQNSRKQQVLRTQQSRSYLNENIYEKTGSSERYKTGYHFKLKQALKENPRNMFYLRQMMHDKDPQSHESNARLTSHQPYDAYQIAQNQNFAQNSDNSQSETTPNQSQTLVEQ